MTARGSVAQVNEMAGSAGEMTGAKGFIVLAIRSRPSTLRIIGPTRRGHHPAIQ